MTAPDDDARFFVPGRIEVLGKHTDYAGGRSLLTAVERGFTIVAAPDAAAALHFVATDTGEAVTRSLTGEAVARTPSGARATRAPAREPVGRASGSAAEPGWARYVDAVTRRVAAHFGDRLRGARVGFSGDLPPAAGLSSSSALLTGLFLGLDAVCGFRDDPRFLDCIPDRESLAVYLAHLERGSPVPGLDEAAPVGAGVGTRGGSEDHTAILCAEAGRIVRYRFEPVRRLGSARLPEAWRFAVGCSGVVAEKAAGARDRYNRLSDRATAAAAAWRAATGGDERTLGAALEAAGDGDRLIVAVEEGARRTRSDPAALADRARHFATEVALVDRAFAAIQAGDAVALGDAADRSQREAEELLGNQVPETSALARLARETGAIAASAFGAGFGGSVWALVPRSDAGAFLAEWERRYARAFPEPARRATFFLTGPAAAAGPLEPGEP